MRTRAAVVIATLALLALAGWTFMPWLRDARGPLNASESISVAVVPFDTVGLPAGEEYLLLGMADALATQLGTLPRFGVRPTSSVLGRAKAQADPLTIGRSLRVDHLLTGLIQRYDDRVRVTVHLTDVATGIQRWSDRIDARFEDLLQLQNAVATRVAASLSDRMTGADRTRLASGQTANPAAYTRYLQARFFLSKAESDDIKSAVDLFQQAIDLDQGYAVARAGLSSAYRMLGLGAVRGLVPHEAMPRAREAALAALRIDPNVAEAHLTLGLVSFAYDWDWAAAERSLQQSIALNPNNGDARRGYGWFLGAMGRFDEALRELHRATELDPVAILARENYGVVLGLAGRPEDALEQLRVASELDPAAPRPHGRRIAILESMGRLDEAIAAWQTSLRAAGDTARADQLGRVLAAGGYRACVEFELRRIEPEAEPLNAANLYAILGDNDKAALYLERALAGKNTWLPFLKVDRRFARLHGHPGFEKVLRQIGL